MNAVRRDARSGLRSLTAWIAAGVLAVGAGAVAGPVCAAPEPGARPVAGGRLLGLGAICDDCQLQVAARCQGLLEGPSAAPDGSLYLTSPSAGRVYRVTTDGTCAAVLDVPPRPGFSPGGTKFHADGRLYGTVIGTTDIFAFDPASRAVSFVASRWTERDRDAPPQGQGGGYYGFNDLAFDQAGGAYMTDMRGSSALRPAGRIVYRTADGDIRVVVPASLALPDGVVLSPDGKTLYFNEWLANRIVAVPVLAPGVVNLGLASVFAYLSGGKGPDGMAVDAAGNLYVAHQGAGGEIAVFAPDGSYYGAIRPAGGGDFSPTNLAFIGKDLYVTEGRPSDGNSTGNAVWRIRTKIGGPKLYRDRSGGRP